MTQSPPPGDEPEQDRPSSEKPSDQPYGTPAYGEQPPQQPYGAPGYGDQSYGAPGYGPPPGYGAQPGYGAPGYGPPMGPPPDNNLVWAILSTVLCCLPLGIVSIVYASQVNSKWAMGDVEGARESSRKARKWAIWSAAVLGIGILLYIAVVVVIIVIGVSTSP